MTACKEALNLSEEAKGKLLNDDYPDNVREFENIIMAAVSMVDGKTILTEKQIIETALEKYSINICIQ